MLPIVIKRIIFDYAISLHIFELQSRLMRFIFKINHTTPSINTLLLGFCLSQHDNSDYALICLEYCLETVERLLDGSGGILGIEDLHNNVFERHKLQEGIYFAYWDKLYSQSLNILKSCVSPLQQLFRRVYYVINEKPLNPWMVSKIRRKISFVFCLDHEGMKKYFSCSVFAGFVNLHLTDRLFLEDVPNEP